MIRVHEDRVRFPASRPENTMSPRGLIVLMDVRRLLLGDLIFGSVFDLRLQ